MSRRGERKRRTQQEDGEERGLWGPVIGLFRLLRGWSQTKLARRAGIAKSRVSLYEAGATIPRPETVERLSRAADIPWALVPPIRSFLRLLRRALRRDARVEPVAWGTRPLEEAQRVAGGIVERVVTLARLELGVRWAIRPASKLAPPTEAELARAEDLCKLLTSFEAKRRPLLVEGSEAYRSWLVCLLLCDRSERAAAHSASEALELAELARLVARSLPEPDTFRPRLEGYAENLVANALRVGNKLADADAAFVRAERLWRSGTDEAGLLDEGRLFDLRASLRRDQRRFGDAVKLHEQALKSAKPERRGHFLLNESATYEEKGDYEASIKVLERADRFINGQRQPRLLFGQRFNLAASLTRLGRAFQAEPIVVEVRELAERLGNDTDLIRTRWLEGLVLAGTGRLEEAVVALRQVRRDFELRNLPYDFALASLDLALFYRDQGRTGEVVGLAVEMLKIFEAAGVHREALAAVILFRDAAEKGNVTAKMVRRLQDYLKRAQREPGVRFGG